MAARLRSQLSFARREGVREQETEPGTPVTGQVSGLLSRHDPSENPPVFIPLVGRQAHRYSDTAAARKAG